MTFVYLGFPFSVAGLFLPCRAAKDNKPTIPSECFQSHSIGNYMRGENIPAWTDNIIVKKELAATMQVHVINDVTISDHVPIISHVSIAN